MEVEVRDSQIYTSQPSHALSLTSHRSPGQQAGFAGKVLLFEEIICKGKSGRNILTEVVSGVKSE